MENLFRCSKCKKLRLNETDWVGNTVKEPPVEISTIVVRALASSEDSALLVSQHLLEEYYYGTLCKRPFFTCKNLSRKNGPYTIFLFCQQIMNKISDFIFIPSEKLFPNLKLFYFDSIISFLKSLSIIVRFISNIYKSFNYMPFLFWTSSIWFLPYLW